MSIRKGTYTTLTFFDPPGYLDRVLVSFPAAEVEQDGLA